MKFADDFEAPDIKTLPEPSRAYASTYNASFLAYFREFMRTLSRVISPFAPLAASGRLISQNGGVGVSTGYTVGAEDASYEVSANVLVTTATTHNFTVQCAYTDEGNTARTLTMSFFLVAGSAVTTAILAVNGAVPYHGIPVRIRAKAGTTIQITTTGTFTTVTYNVEAAIRKVS